MNSDEIRSAIAESLHRVAPEADLATVGGDDDLREAFDLDSFDFLNLVIGIHARTGVNIPEADYGNVTTLAEMMSYIESRMR